MTNARRTARDNLRQFFFLFVRLFFFSFPSRSLKIRGRIDTDDGYTLYSDICVYRNTSKYSYFME